MLRFTKDHEWVRIDGDVGTCGISDYAQAQLGDVVFVELPELGRKLDRRDAAAVVESVKAASEVYAPLAGEVIEVNQAIVDEPARVNAGATTDGWFFKLKLADGEQAGDLMDEASYASYVEGLA